MILSVCTNYQVQSSTINTAVCEYWLVWYQVLNSTIILEQADDTLRSIIIRRTYTRYNSRTAVLDVLLCFAVLLIRYCCCTGGAAMHVVHSRTAVLFTVLPGTAV